MRLAARMRERVQTARWWASGRQMHRRLREPISRGVLPSGLSEPGKRLPRGLRYPGRSRGTARQVGGHRHLQQRRELPPGRTLRRSILICPETPARKRTSPMNDGERDALRVHVVLYCSCREPLGASRRPRGCRLRSPVCHPWCSRRERAALPSGRRRLRARDGSGARRAGTRPTTVKVASAVARWRARPANPRLPRAGVTASARKPEPGRVAAEQRAVMQCRRSHQGASQVAESFHGHHSRASDDGRVHHRSSVACVSRSAPPEPTRRSAASRRVDGAL